MHIAALARFGEPSMTRLLSLALLGSLGALASLPAADPPKLKIYLRSSVQPFKGSDPVEEVRFTHEIVPSETALILCDVWDDHWCKKASERCCALAKKMDTVAKAARAKSVFVIHAPSDCMDFYKNSPARERMKGFPRAEMPKALALPDPPCPVDSSDGGCDDEAPVTQYKAWTRQHAAIEIDEAKDGVTDSGQEVYNLMAVKGIKNLLVMGVHTNMCVLHRSFAIKPMTRLGVKCVLVRDLTDAMYNPKMKPNVSHEEGTDRIIRFIEQNWCPTMLSKDLLGE
jgi:nicotinamidase-related amidase